MMDDDDDDGDVVVVVVVDSEKQIIDRLLHFYDKTQPPRGCTLFTVYTTGHKFA